MKKFKYKMLLAFGVVLFLAFAGMGSYNLYTNYQHNQQQVESYRTNQLEAFDLRIKNEVNTAMSLLQSAYSQYKLGEISEAEAKELGTELLKELRYGDAGYFWIDGMDGELIAHPMLPGEEGSNRLDIQDPEGTYLIQNIVSAATEGESGGYSEYMWEKPGEEDLVAKRTYSELFEPWNYIVSTGNYTDEIDALTAQKEDEYNQKMERDMWVGGGIVAVLLLLSAIIALLFSNRISRKVTEMTEHVNQVANKNLEVEDLSTRSHDEFGDLSRAINQMTMNLRHMIGNVSDASKHLSQQSDELTHSADEVQQGSNQIVQTMEELSTGVESQADYSTSLAESTDKLVQRIQQAQEMGDSVYGHSTHVVEMSQEGRTMMKQSVEQMNTIDEIVKNSVTKVKGLDAQTKEITKIGSVIKDIADQTNLLSLNAAIEAARAGESGKGFAVVAEEVRKLADQVAHSVVDINQIVANIREESTFVSDSLTTGYEEVNKGTQQINATEERFESIHTSVSGMVDQIQQISANLTEITEESSEMNQSIAGIAALSEESAAGVQQVTASAQQSNSAMEEITSSTKKLSQLSEDLNSQVNEFQWKEDAEPEQEEETADEHPPIDKAG